MTSIIFIISIIILLFCCIYLLWSYLNRNKAKHIYIYPLLLGILILFITYIGDNQVLKDSCSSMVFLLIALALILLGIILMIIQLIIFLLSKVNNKLEGNKKRLFKLVIIFILLILIFYSLFLLKTKINREISKNLDIKVPNTINFDMYENSHGGFHGDGITLARARLTPKQIDLLLGKNIFYILPMEDNIQRQIYGSHEYESNLSKRLMMGKIDNGYYKFKDTSSHKLKLDYFSNFSIVIIDIDNKILYYINYDS